MTDPILTLASNRDVPIAQITRILVAATKAKLSQARLKLFGPPAVPSPTHRVRRQNGSSHFVQMGFGGLIADHSDDSFSAIHLLAGSEVVHRSRIGVLAEIGLGSGMESFEYLAGLATLNAVVRPVGRLSSIEPFVTGGWSILFRTGGVGAWNVGAGLTAYSGNRADLRIEIRDYIRFGVQLLEFRVGMAF
jgi:hypothetical protein